MKKMSVNKAKALKILTVLAIFSIISIGAYALSAKEVTIAIDDNKKEVVTHSGTVKELLQEESIALKKGAYISVPLDTKLENNMNIIIKTPKPYVLAIDDKKCEIESIYVKVKDILKDKDIELGAKDYTYPDLNEEVTPNTEIQIYRIKEVVETIEETIPHETLVKQNNNMDIGQERIAQEGQDGLKNIEVNKRYENGKLIEEKVISEEIVKEPVPKIIEKGTKNVLTASRGSFRYRKTLNMIATAYDLSYESTGKKPGDKYYGITASGTKARVGVVAVDPKVIPLGTKLYIESLDGSKDYGFCIAEDTGGAIKGNRIDLFFNSKAEAKRFGRKQVKVYVLE